MIDLSKPDFLSTSYKMGSIDDPTRRSDIQAETDTCRRNRTFKSWLAGGVKVFACESDKSGTRLFWVIAKPLLPPTWRTQVTRTVRNVGGAIIH
jgi:hypothetical protein